MSPNRALLEQKLIETRFRLIKGNFPVAAEEDILASMAKTIETLCVSIPEDDIIVKEAEGQLPLTEARSL